MRDISETDRNSELLLRTALSSLKPDEDGIGVVSPLDELSSRRTIDSVIARLDRLNRKSVSRTHRLRWAAGASTLILSAAFAAMFFCLQDADAPLIAEHSAQVSTSSLISSKASIQTQSFIPGSRFELLFGDVSCGDKDVTMGAGIPLAERIRTKSGKVALSLPTGIAVGLSENASARVLWDGKASYGVSLISGTALFSVAPDAKRDGFFVETSAGTVRVTGTLFSVMVSPDNGVFVKLHRGKVTVEKPDGQTRSMESTELTAISRQTANLEVLNQEIDRQLQTIQLIDEGSLFTELRSLQEPKEEDALNVGKARRFAGERFVSQLSIQDLMNLARSRKSSGNWIGAASSYNELIRMYFGADEARTSMVSLGQIYLNHLNRPKDALREFNRYLKYPEGPLSQEALYGKSQAFRALNNRAMEIQTLQSFLASYPSGILAKSVQLRLAELGV